jgi:hypothetical protein
MHLPVIVVFVFNPLCCHCCVFVVANVVIIIFVIVVAGVVVFVVAISAAAAVCGAFAVGEHYNKPYTRGKNGLSLLKFGFHQCDNQVNIICELIMTGKY